MWEWPILTNGILLFKVHMLATQVLSVNRNLIEVSEQQACKRLYISWLTPVLRLSALRINSQPLLSAGGTFYKWIWSIMQQDFAIQ